MKLATLIKLYEGMSPQEKDNLQQELSNKDINSVHKDGKVHVHPDDHTAAKKVAKRLGLEAHVVKNKSINEAKGLWTSDGDVYKVVKESEELTEAKIPAMPRRVGHMYTLPDNSFSINQLEVNNTTRFWLVSKSGQVVNYTEDRAVANKWMKNPKRLNEAHPDLAPHTVKESEELQEISKTTLGSYIKKASASASGLATSAMHHRNASLAWDKEEDKAGPGSKEEKHAKKQSKAFNQYSFDATEKQIKRQKGIEKATDKLVKEEDATN